jgi:hypothetical protein
MRRLLAALVAAGSLAPLLVACEPATVEISFRPRVGTNYRYEVAVRTATTTRFAGAPAEHAVEDARLVADDTVLSAGPQGVQVQVRLRRSGSPERTYLVRLDRGAQLAGVEAVEGLPPAVLGPEALPEILPGSPGAPPDRPLGPGERWTIDARPAIPGVEAQRLRGWGQLLELGLRDGERVATTRSVTVLPLRSSAQVRGGTLLLDGTETTDTTATRSLVDGSIEESSSLTHGEFRITLAPPSPDEGGLVTGTLSIEVRSQTRRLQSV